VKFSLPRIQSFPSRLIGFIELLLSHTRQLEPSPASKFSSLAPAPLFYDFKFALKVSIQKQKEQS